MADQCKVCGAPATVHLEPQKGVSEPYCQAHAAAREIQRRAAASGLVYLGTLETEAREAPDASASRRQAGIEHLQKGDLRGANDDLPESIRIAGRLAERGRGRYEAGDLDGAIVDLTKAIELNPEHAWAHNARGWTRMAQGDLDSAIADCTKALANDSEFTAAYYGRGVARRAKGELEGIADVLKAVESYLWPLAVLLDDPNLPHEAALEKRRAILPMRVDEHTKAAEIELQETVAHYKRGRRLTVEEDCDGAAAEFTRAIEKNPRFAQAYVMRAEVYVNCGSIVRFDYRRAIEDYSKVVEIEPQNADAYSDRGFARHMLHDLDGAVQDFSKAIEIDPTHGVSFSRRASVLEEKGDEKGALADQQKADELEARSAEAYSLYQHGLELESAAAEATSHAARNEHLTRAAADYRQALDFAPRGWRKRSLVELALKGVGRKLRGEP